MGRVSAMGVQRVSATGLFCNGLPNNGFFCQRVSAMDVHNGFLLQRARKKSHGHFIPGLPLPS